MNPFLTNEICKHILTGFGVSKSLLSGVQINSKSLNSDEYLLPQKIVFLNDDGSDLPKDVWGCQITISTQTFTVLLVDLSVESDDCYALFVHLKDAPAYAIYLDKTDSHTVNESMICCSTDSEHWMICNTYLESMFLAGMEQIRELGVTWHKASDYISDFDMLKSFLSFSDSLLGDGDEGKED